MSVSQAVGGHSHNPLGRFLREHFTSEGNLDEGLALLNELLGLAPGTHVSQEPRDDTIKVPTQQHARAVIYAPDMDGQADPGEVIWISIRTHKGAELELRAVLIIGRLKHTLLGLLISSNPAHAHKPQWIGIGSGPWDAEGAESFVCLDKLLEIPESGIQRRGVSMPERRFERIATRLRTDYGWH